MEKEIKRLAKQIEEYRQATLKLVEALERLLYEIETDWCDRKIR